MEEETTNILAVRDILLSIPDDGTAFWLVFNVVLQEGRDLLIEALKSTNVESIKAVKERATAIQQYITNACVVLPPYDVRRSQETLDQFRKEVKAAEEKIAPKKKFAFSRSNKSAASSSSSASAMPAPPLTVPKAEEGVKVEAALPEGAYAIKDRENETITLSASPVTAEFAQLFIQNVKSSAVSLLFLSGSVRIENCEQSQVFLGPCQTSVYLESCHHCTIYTASHQLRIHNCTYVTLYVLCQSHPIIEDSKHMFFAPYPVQLHADYSTITLNEDLLKANLQDAVGNNKWREVVDFNWHKVEPSPNWTILMPAMSNEGSSKIVIEEEGV